MYYLKISKDYLTTQLDFTTKTLLGYTNDYKYGQLLLPFDYEGKQAEYLECEDGDIIAQLRLPGAYVKDGKDRALNKCIKGELQPTYLMYAYGKFGIQNILTDITNINLKQ